MAGGPGARAASRDQCHLFDPENNEAASARPFQIRVGVAAFALGGLVEGQLAGHQHWPGPGNGADDCTGTTIAVCRNVKVVAAQGDA